MNGFHQKFTTFNFQEETVDNFYLAMTVTDVICAINSGTNIPSMSGEIQTCYTREAFSPSPRKLHNATVLAVRLQCHQVVLLLDFWDRKQCRARVFTLTIYKMNTINWCSQKSSMGCMITTPYQHSRSGQLHQHAQRLQCESCHYQQCMHEAFSNIFICFYRVFRNIFKCAVSAVWAS